MGRNFGGLMSNIYRPTSDVSNKNTRLLGKNSNSQTSNNTSPEQEENEFSLAAVQPNVLSRTSSEDAHVVASLFFVFF